MSEDHPERIDVETLVGKFAGKNYDAVINLTPHIDLDMARFMSRIKTPKRIGFFGPGSDELYNIQIRSVTEDDFTAAYDQILALCDLGPEPDHPDYRLWG